jgi:hypothetical protein
MLKLAAILTGTPIALTGEAATAYRLEYYREGWPRASSRTEKVTVDGPNVRVDLARDPDTVATHHTVLSRDGGKTFVAINDELRTWYWLGSSPFVVSAGVLSGMSGKGAVRNIKWSTGDSSGGAPATEAPARQHQLSYVLEERFEETRVRIKCTAILKIWTAPELDASLWPGHVAFVTGIPQLDAEIASRIGPHQGFPERIVLVATKQFDGGSLTTETISMRVVDVESVPDVPADLFERPRGYKEQAPVLAAPGL